ncbi:hypothetical protein [Schaalia odontolytica]|uniref:hypothetical protein n=1 Tax=Schaalia odontolytica TaxID=1660 RepID=UPI0028D639E4|nr:hypothetical protein [Schaalia odontolytica]
MPGNIPPFAAMLAMLAIPGATAEASLPAAPGDAAGAHRLVRPPPALLLPGELLLQRFRDPRLERRGPASEETVDVGRPAPARQGRAEAGGDLDDVLALRADAGTGFASGASTAGFAGSAGPSGTARGARGLRPRRCGGGP